MTEVMIYKDCLGNIRGYRIKGHAEYAPYGEDIVCAALSILSHTALMSLIELCGIKENHLDSSTNEDQGYFDLKLPKNIKDTQVNNSQIILRSFEIGVSSLVESYPKYVILKYGEV